MTFKKKHETLSYHLNSEEIINFTIINVILKKQKQLILQKIRLANFNLLKSPFLTQSAQLSSKMNTDDLSISVLCSFFFFFIAKLFLWKLTGQLAPWSQFSITLGMRDKIIWTFVDNIQTSLNHSSLSFSEKVHKDEAKCVDLSCTLFHLCKLIEEINF